MSRRQKRLERIRQNPKNVSVADLRLVLEDYGFEYRKTVGSHYTFTYLLEDKIHLFVVPFRRPVKPVYVKRALKIIDHIIQEQGGSDDQES
jgi:hypothetical protein